MKAIHYLAAATLLSVSTLAPGASAFRLLGGGGKLVFQCGDGTIRECGTATNPPVQKDCDKNDDGTTRDPARTAQIAAHACEGHGGFIRLQMSGMPGDPGITRFSGPLVLEQGPVPGVCFVPEIAFTPDDVYEGLLVTQGFTPPFCGGVLGTWY